MSRRGTTQARGCGPAGIVAAARAVLTGCAVPGLVSGAVLAGCADDGGPRLDAVAPAAAQREAVVTITGRRLCGADGDCARATGEVLLGIEPPMVRANVVSYTDTAAAVAIPDVTPLGATSLVVTVGERSSNALAFEVVP